MSANRDTFWRLCHDDLAAFLHCTDLSWELARVYLALADFTYGYQKDKDTVSLGQIEKVTGIHRRHVSRALKELAKAGLYGQQGEGDKVVRWVVFPPPSVPEAGNTQGVPDVVPRGVPESGGGGVPRGVPGAGAHQDSKKGKTTKTTKKALPRPVGRTPTFTAAKTTTHYNKLGRQF